MDDFILYPHWKTQAVLNLFDPFDPMDFKMPEYFKERGGAHDHKGPRNSVGEEAGPPIERFQLLKSNILRSWTAGVLQDDDAAESC